MASTVRYEADELTARFLMGDREEVTDDDLPVCSAQSPLGMTLQRGEGGDRRKFSFPEGSRDRLVGERGGRSCSLCRANGKPSDPCAPAYPTSTGLSTAC